MIKIRSCRKPLIKRNNSKARDSDLKNWNKRWSCTRASYLMGWQSLKMTMKTPLYRRKHLSRIWLKLSNLMPRILRKNSWRAFLIWVNWMPRSLANKRNRIKMKKKTEISQKIPVCSHRRTLILTSSSWRRACLMAKFLKSARWIRSQKWRQMK